MIPDPHPELVGRNVVLRRFDSGQINARFVSWLNDPEVNRYSQRAGQRTTEGDARAYLDGLASDEIVLGIHCGSDGHVGNIKYGPVDWNNSRADVSILIGERSVWGRGIGREAVFLVTRFLFEDLGLNRVDAGSNNQAFLALVEKLGWKTEGVLRERVRTAEGFIDHTLVSLLRREFVDLHEFQSETVSA